MSSALLPTDPCKPRAVTGGSSKLKADACFLFGPFELVPEQALLLEDGVPVRLGSRAFEILMLLVDRSPEVVSHRDILDHVWPDTSVDEVNLRVNLSALRKSLHERERNQRYIINTPGFGYRFAAPVVRRQRPETASTPHSSILSSLTPLLGRDEAAQTIARELRERRFVTVTGPGGVGKTSVAREVARQLSCEYRDGAYLVDLTAVSDADRISASLRSGLQLTPLQDSDLPCLFQELRERQVVIVLDNCEHCVEAAAHLAEDLLKTSSASAVLATCREPLRAEGEWVFRLTGLETPPRSSVLTSAVALEFPAIRLFVERADAGAGPFVLTDAEAPALAELCIRLDGIPLAIELAAARVGVFGIAGLTERLGHSFALLTRGRRTAQPRHKSMQATLDWSFDLLSTAERMLLTRLSIFRTSFTEEAATAIAACDKVTTSDVVLGLTELTEKSLAIAKLHGSTVLYRLLETTRIYAIGKLSKHPERDEICRRHTQYLRTLRTTAGDVAFTDAARTEEHFRFTDEIRTASISSFSDG
jgi:predicted ATPase/DNA-binding winged helix-turn-helix (wHTH) protein